MYRWDDDVVFKNCAKAEPKKVHYTLYRHQVFIMMCLMYMYKLLCIYDIVHQESGLTSHYASFNSTLICVDRSIDLYV